MRQRHSHAALRRAKAGLGAEVGGTEYDPVNRRQSVQAQLPKSLRNACIRPAELCPDSA